MRFPVVLLVAFFWLSAQAAHAQPRNSYGAKGRTVLSGGFSGLAYGDGHTRSHEAWRVAASATLVHFVRENFAIGGTFTMDLSQRPNTGYAGERHDSYSGGDLDLIGHVPLSRRLSLRLWGWLGMRQRNREDVLLDPSRDFESHRSQKVLQAVFGFAPKLLVHCSSSVALELGPALHVYAPINEAAIWDWSLNIGPQLSYSFGPPAVDEESRRPIVPRFAQRGRNVLTGGVLLGTSTFGSLGYARFVSDHFALGPRLFGGAHDGESDGLGVSYWAGGGLQMLAELPIKGRWSLLFSTEVDYRYDQFDTLAHGLFDDRESLARAAVRTHELQFSQSVFPVFHLFEALVIGLGPTITEHLRLAANVDALERAYFSLGATSMMAGSF